MSLRCILLCDFVVYVFYIETAPVPPTVLRQNYCEDRCQPWRPADFPPQHCQYLGDTQTRGIGVISTPWAIVPELGLGIFTTQDEQFALLERAFYHDFLLHVKTSPTWLPPMTIPASNHCPPQFCHVEMMVKCIGMGYCQLLLAKIGHPQLPQPTNTGTAR